MKATVLAFALMATGVCASASPRAPYQIIDGHNDLAFAVRKAKEAGKPEPDIGRNSRPLHTDIPRLREGQVGGQFWSAYMGSEYSGETATKLFLEQIDLIHRINVKYHRTFEMAENASDVQRIMADGKIASFIGVEGGHAINSSLRVLKMFFEKNVRYMTLTHWLNNEWADSATDPKGPRFHGLSSFGKQVVREMNKLGMLVDLSHVSDAVMHQALDVSIAPVIFSHSSVRAVCNHPRNVPDDVLRRIPKNGGVVMINFYAGFISEAYMKWEKNKQGQRPRVTINQVADHFDYLRRTVGVDHIGIGADYDGVDVLPEGLEDVSKYPVLFAELRRRGFTEEDLYKIAHGNILRALARAEEMAKEL